MSASFYETMDSLTTVLATGDLHPADLRAALTHIAPAVEALATYGLSTDAASYRDSLAEELASVCTQVAGEPQRACGRCSELATAASEIATILNPDLNPDGRWAAVLSFAVAARRITAAHPPEEYDPRHEQPLEWIRHVAVLLEHLGALEPPRAAAAIPLERSLHEIHVEACEDNLATARRAIDTLQRRTRSATRGTPLPVAALTSTIYACETLCAFAAAFAIHEEQIPPNPGNASAAAWRNAAHTLTPLEDGSRAPHQRPVPAALSAHEVYFALNREFGTYTSSTADQLAQREDRDQLAAFFRETLCYLPGIAIDLKTNIRQATEHGQFLIMAKLATSPDNARKSPGHVTVLPIRLGYLHQRITARAADLDECLTTLSAADLLSTQLADEFHRHAVPKRPGKNQHLRLANHTRATHPDTAYHTHDAAADAVARLRSRQAVPPGRGTARPR